jgi:hypothetical protein
MKSLEEQIKKHNKRIREIKRRNIKKLKKIGVLI